ncbi:dual specificity protein phosphatase 16-like [Limulus polyphemus]|uniref:protein-tyrosine-phosphatase n=1 Tax=Limulus polyphemus TaxID=6850 RepID=A0ABM1TCA5_LIMPO|nr:dual specificity protein phosphatase 16-like [Limulus polyphemus]XP_022253511.1 dual specificity protein phosphatase 16-like [Limulus polyphemus]
MASKSLPITIVDVHQLAAVVRNQIDTVLIIDSRSFLEYNTNHVASAVNVCCSKLVKRRLQQDKISVKDLLIHTCQFDIHETYDVVVYDQGSYTVDINTTDTFIAVLMKKLAQVFRSVNLVKGGFLEFQAAYPNLCEDKTWKCSPLTSLSQPCLSVMHQGPTKILPFMYLGSQSDAFNKEMLNNHNITYELNVSANCPKPDFIQDTHFMRISVNDNYSEKLLPFFPKAFQFLDKVREASGCVLVHCLAGISRSPTIAIAYVMHYLRLSSDVAYRYVKSKRVTISPNFNFLGQLLEFEKQLRNDSVLDCKPEVMSAPPDGFRQRGFYQKEKQQDLRLSLSKPESLSGENSPSEDQSPTAALSKLSFENHERDPEENGKRKQSRNALKDNSKRRKPGNHIYRSVSCTGCYFTDSKENNKDSFTDDSKLSSLVLDRTYISGYHFSSNMYTSAVTTRTCIDTTDEKFGNSQQHTLPQDSYSLASVTLNLPCPQQNSIIAFETIIEATPSNSSSTWMKSLKDDSHNSSEEKQLDWCTAIEENKAFDFSKQVTPTSYLLARDIQYDGQHTEKLKHSEEATIKSENNPSQKFAYLPVKKSVHETQLLIQKDNTLEKLDHVSGDLPFVVSNENPLGEITFEDPLSPSERHLLEEFMETDDLTNTDEIFLSRTNNIERDTYIDPDRHDSGVPASPSSVEAPLQLSRDDIQRYTKCTENTCVSSKESFKENFTEGKNSRLPKFQENILENLPGGQRLLGHNWFLSKESRKKNENREGLYRAQSCPVIADKFHQSAGLNYFDTRSTVNCGRVDSPYMRKMKLPQSEWMERTQNRLSFGSLECEHNDWKYSNFSCPDMSDFATGQRSQGSSPASVFSPTHVRRHIRMIQVS